MWSVNVPYFWPKPDISLPEYLKKDHPVSFMLKLILLLTLGFVAVAISGLVLFKAQ